MPAGLVTGASQGLGLALTIALVEQGWHVTVDARDGVRLVAAVGRPGVTALPGDVSDARHRARLAASLESLDLLVLNASELGPSPLPALRDVPLDALRRIYDVNVLAPVALLQAVLPLLRRSRQPVVMAISSDAAVEAYAGWGAYGSSKASLDQVMAVLGVEEPELRAYSVDPGDMRTAMHQHAFPGQDIGDRPEAATVVPSLLHLLSARPASGRYRAADLPVAA